MPKIADIKSSLPELQGLDDEQALNVIHEVYYPTTSKAELAARLGVNPAKPPVEEGGNFGRGFNKAMIQIPQTIGGAIALGGDLAGADGVRDYGMQMYDANAKKAEALTRDTDSFSHVLENGGEGTGNFLAHGAGYVTGQAATAVATGGIGGFIGSQLAKRGIKEVVARGAESAMAKQVAGKVAANGAKIGAGAGLFGSNLVQEAGSIYPEAVEEAHAEGRELDGLDKARVVGSAVVAAGVDTAMDAVMAGRVLAGGRKVVKDPKSGLLVNEGYLKAGAREIPGGIAREGVTEGIQTAIERYGAGQELSTADAIRDYVDSMALGALGGGMGGAASLLHAQKVPESGPLTRAANAGTEDKVLQLTNDPEPFIVFPDGSTGRKSEMEAYLASLPEEQQIPERARLLGKGPQKLTPEEKQADVYAVEHANSQENIRKFSEMRAPESLEDAYRKIQTPGGKNAGLAIVAHAYQDGFTLLPTKMLSIEDQVAADDYAKQAADTLKAREAEAKAAAKGQNGITAAETGYGKTDELASLVEQEKTDLHNRRTDYLTKDKIRRESELEAIGGRVEHADLVKSARARFAILDAVLGDAALDTPDRRAKKFAAELKRAGYANNAIRLDEQAHIERHAAIEDAFDNDQEPSLPNEMDVAALIPEKKPKPPAPKPAAVAKPNPQKPVAAVPDTVLNPKGEPFKTEFAAKKKLRDAALMDSHEVVKAESGDGFVLKKKAQDQAAFEAAAHEAATSPTNDMPEPTQAQKEAGNYKVGRVKVHGLDISIENPAGSVRKGVDRDGKAWENTLAQHYGYIKGTVGADKDHIDAFVHGTGDTDKVYIVDQVHPDTGKFDEHKVIFGAGTAEEARSIYQANYAKDWQGGKDISETSVEGFKTWLKDGDTKKPYAKAAAEPKKDEPPAFHRKLLADMTDDELRSAQGYYAPEHARSPKIEKEMNKRGMTAQPEKAPALQARDAKIAEKGETLQGAATEQPKPAPAKSESAPTAKKPSSGAQVARDRLKAENPFLAFLAADGIAMEDKADAGMDRGNAGNRMVPGFGPIFRKTGPRLDVLALRAQEEGFLTQDDIDNPNDAGGTRKLADMIQRAVAGKEIIQRAATADDAAERAAQQMQDDDLLREASQAGIDTDGKSLDQVYDEVVAHHAAGDAALITDDTLDAMLELAFHSTDEQPYLTDAQLDEIFGPAKKSEGAHGAEEGTRTDARGRGEEDRAGPGDFSLAGETVDEAKARLDADEARRKAAEKADADANQRAQADTEVGSFTLTGSDRAADVGAAQGQKDIFSGRMADDTIEIDGKQRPTVNSEGKQIAYTTAGLRDFYKWFKDSKVVDEQGRPLVVYHGSSDSFDVFDIGRLGDNTGANDAQAGFHFSDNKADASLYADMAARAKAKRDDPSGDGYGSTGVVRPFYLSLQNPLIVGMDKGRGNAGERTQEFLDDKLSAKRYAEENGMDGIIYLHGTNVDSGYTAIAFDPTQIKSVDNIGTFRADDARIMYAQDDHISATPEFDLELARDVGAQKPVDELLAKIEEQSVNPQHSELAKALRAQGLKTTFEIGSAKGRTFAVAGDSSKFAAGYQAKTDKAYLFRLGNAEQNILHELVHAATMRALRKGGLGATQMKALYQHVQKSGAANGLYGMENLDEFVAEAFSNRRFQTLLRDIPAMRTGSRFKNAWDQFVAMVKRLLGFDVAQMTALEQVLEAGRNLMDENQDKPVKRTETAAFKAWFGNSKVVDADGKPLVVYHGTNADFDSFDPEKLGSESNAPSATMGFFFASNPTVASSYADTFNVHKDTKLGRLSGKLSLGLVEKIDNAVLRMVGGKPVEGGNVMPVYLAIQNPKVVDFGGSKYREKTYAEVIAEAKAEGHDGVILRNTFDHGYVPHSGEELTDVYIAFRPEDIKSATGNNGNFDPDTDDITGSMDDTIAGNVAQGVDSFLNTLGVQETARNKVSDLFQSQKTFNGFWHKTVGTQYHKAQIDHHFKRVYDAAQRYLSTVSLFANEAADAAPTLLPKLEGLRDLTKKPAPKADVEAAGRAIFEGTLNDAKVYSDAELKEKFKLTPAQIGLYREFRAATDKSLDDMGKTDILRYAGKAGKHLVNRVMGAKTVNDGAALLAEHLESIGKIDAAEVIRDKAEKIAGLKLEGYAPLMRFGEHTVYVTDDQGNQLFFGMAETAREAAALARDMKETYPKATVTQGILSTEGAKLFSGISPDTIEVFAKTTGLDKDPLFQDYLKLVVNNRSALKRLIHRKGVAGFSQDTTRVLASFLTSNARASSKNLHGGEMTQAANDIPKTKGDVRDEAIRLVDYIQNPIEEAAKIRGLLFTNFIGGSIASAMVNMTQPITMTLPYLAQFGGAGKAATTLMGAMKQAVLPDSAITDKALRDAMHQAEREGVVSPQEIHNLQAEAMRSSRGIEIGGKQVVPAFAMRKLAVVWGGFFGLAEQFNRKATFIAAYQIAQKMTSKQFEQAGVKDAYAFAVKAIAETQGTYNKGNKANWARGAIGSTLMTFRQYGVHYLEFLSRLPNKEKALALGILMAASGAQGLPFSDDLDDIIETIAQALGYNFNSKKAKERFITNILGEGGAAFVMNGVSGVGGMPIDVSIRMGMGNLLPATGMFKKSETDKSRQYAEILGAAGGFSQKVVKAGDKLLDGDPAGAAMAVAATAIQNAAKAVDMMQNDMYRDTRGRKVIDTDPVDALVKGIGFQPSNVAREQEKLNEARQDIAVVKAVKMRIADQWAQGVFDKDPEATRKAREAIGDWNRKNPESKINITTAQVAKRVHEMRLEKSARMIKTAPKEMRAGLRGELE